jgi:hypothetical protein
MYRIKIVFGFCLLQVLLLVACKKKEEPQPEPLTSTPCPLYNTVSTDTNYIPHHRNNLWAYCSDDINRAGYSATIKWDSVIGTSLYFDRLFHTSSSHAPSPYYPERWRIDSQGNYYRMTYWKQYTDTLLLIKPSASNGDTLYSNAAKTFNVILINKNETVENIPGCYHVLEQNGYEAHHYYKKGIGELYFNGFTLSNAVIH